MNHIHYLKEFNDAKSQLDTGFLDKKQMEAAVGVWLKSVALKLYKQTWINGPDLSQSKSSIFFSVWVNDEGIKANKIFYNIHALKLRNLNGYSLTSREFAAAFRTKFKAVEAHWPNVSIDYGPLTLMEGWTKLNEASLQKDIVELANNFIKIDYMIDDILAGYKKPVIK